MPPVSMRAFKTALEHAKPDAVYALHGENDFLKDEKVRDLLDALVDPATRDFNCDMLRGGEAAPGILDAALNALPMLSTRRVVVVRDAGALKKPAKAVLDRYVAHPSPEAVVVLVYAGDDAPDAAIAGHASMLELRALTPDEAAAWTMAHGAKLGRDVAASAAALIVRATGGDLAAIDGELRKLRDFVATGTIDDAAVGAIVGIRSGETQDDLLDAVCARDGVRAAALVGPVLSQPKASGVGLVLALTTHVLGLGHAGEVRAGGAGPRQVASELYALMGESRSSVVGRPWGEAVAAWTRHADRWSPRDVERGLRALHDADGQLKASGVSGEEQIITSLVLELCHRPAARAA